MPYWTCYHIWDIQRILRILSQRDQDRNQGLCRWVYIVSLRLLYLEMSACNVNARRGSVCELGWYTVPYTDIKPSLIDNGGLLCLNCLYTHTVYVKKLFSFWDSGTLVHDRQRVPTRAAPNINLGHWALLGFPGHKHDIQVAAFLLLF